MAVSLVLALRLQVSTDISALMPAHSRISGTLLDVLKEFGTTDRLVLVIESTSTGTDENARERNGGRTGERRRLRELADRVAGGMEQSSLIEAVDYRVTAEQRDFFESLYFDHPFHFQDAGDLQDLRARLTPAAIEERVTALAQTLRYSPMGASAQRQLLLDPLDLRGGQQEGLGLSKLGGFHLDLGDGYFFSASGHSIFIIAKPLLPSQDTEFDARLLVEIETLLQEAGGTGGLGKDYSMPIGDGFVVRLIGPYVETLYGSQAAQEELLPTIALTCLGLLALFAGVFRSIGILLVLAVPLAVGILATAALTSLFAGQLTMITVGFAAMLAGLGVDFGIHLVDRIGQESAQTPDLRDRIAHAFATTGRGVVAGALTSAAIFLLIAVSDFAALQQFGWIIGAGIVITLVATFTLLPALLVSVPVTIRPPRITAGTTWASQVVAHHRLLGLAGIVITLGLGFAAAQLTIQSNIYALGPMNPDYEQEKQRILAESGGATNVVMAVVERAQLQDLLQVSERIGAALKSLQVDGAIESYEQLGSILPSDRSQQDIVETVRTWGLPAAMEVFEAALTEAGFRTSGFDPFVEHVLAYASGDGPRIDLESLRGTPGEELLARFLLRRPDCWKAVAYVYPSAGQWQERVPAAVVEAIEAAGAGVVVTGIVPSFNEISNYVREEFLGLTVAALMMVLLIAMIFLRRPLLAVLSTVPAVVGLVWTLGLMQLAGIELNLVTILVAPMIIGLGIDYALHLLNRHLEQPDRIDASVAHVSRAILMTSATTIIGFGSLAFAELASLRALGLTVSAGILCCAVTSLLLLPAMLTALAGRK